MRRGRDEVQGLATGTEERLADGRVRRAGAGRKPIEQREPGLIEALEGLIEPTVRGEPDSPLRWTTKSLRKLSAELAQKGITAGPSVLGEILRSRGYSLQALSKTREGGEHPDRDAQFQHIHDRVVAQQAAGQPVISVDTKKKELVGDFKNGGAEWQPKGKPEPVRVHDFVDPLLGKAIPYGIYDLSADDAWVNVGIDHDTPAFAVESIRRWWQRMGRLAYPQARRLLITADGGGSNGSRARAWKVELQRLANETGLIIEVCHLPPGTSKWNKTEHRLFSHIAMNWRGRPLESLETIVSLIGSTTTRSGLRVRAELDTGTYPVGVKIDDATMKSLALHRHKFHGEWNYELHPQTIE